MYPEQQIINHITMQNESMGKPKCNKMMNQERMIINLEYQRERMYYQGYTNTPSSIYMNKRLLGKFCLGSLGSIIEFKNQ
jgi:hypothetical protein